MLFRSQRNCFTATHGQAAPWTTSRYLLPLTFYLLPLTSYLLPLSYEVCLCEAVSFRATGGTPLRVQQFAQVEKGTDAIASQSSKTTICHFVAVPHLTRPTQLLHRNARTSRTLDNFALPLTSYLLPLTSYLLPLTSYLLLVTSP